MQSYLRLPGCNSNTLFTTVKAFIGDKRAYMNRNLNRTILRSFHMLHFQHDQIKKQKERNPEAKKMDEQVGTYIM
jgi:hypothetical protein